ncbi:hypothetical protein Q8A67_003495 [Cirrhinus molitorella]|uniref:Uncharacterized protein n=1 Tax=Cirrhinus molitorella TaxID=172907 RepID=A0AA88Q9J8_9TELE|nr:hypothetical protein Q8A67_003495 [Cirrhinus molitorella]
MPPGPWGFPFLGNVFIGFDCRGMDEVAAKFGNIFRVGYDKIVLVSGYEWVKEVLVTQGDYFLDRLISPISRKWHFSEQWIQVEEAASFYWLSPEGFAEGKNALESHILQECIYLCQSFEEQQEKVQDEIDCVIGKWRQPRLADRASMPYTDAVLHETQRVCNLFPLTAPHLTSQNSAVAGYFIPKVVLLL